MLTIGSNSYATITEADEYVNDYYECYHPLRVHWSVLGDDEKETYLRRSIAEIDKLHFLGRKYNAYAQRLAFPRIRPDSGNLYNGGFFSFTYAGESEIPEEVKQAQIENAIGIISKQISATADKQAITMQSLGAVKDTKGQSGTVGADEAVTHKCPLSSEKAYRLLRGWLGGVQI